MRRCALMASKWLVALLPVALALGAGCGPGGVLGGETVLVDQSTPGPPNGVTFTPSAVGRTVTVTVTGNATVSRVALQVNDSTGVPVAVQTQPTTNTTQVTFVTTSNGLHTILAQELVAISSPYATRVTESN